MSDRREIVKEQIARGLKQGFYTQPLASSESEGGGIGGKIEPGDGVKTLNRRQAIYGEVIRVAANGMATMRGRTQPGAQLQTVSAHVENLELLGKGNGAELVARDEAD